MLGNESSDGHEAEEYVGLADFVAEGDEQAKHCAACQKKQCSLKNPTEYTPIVVAQPWDIVGMDLVGKLTPTKEGYQYICVMVDYFTKWCEALPLKTKSAEELSFSVGDKLRVYDRSSDVWWWAELQGHFGYVPSSYLHQRAEDEEDAWQDEEYFGNYGALRLHLEMLSDKPRTETYRQVIRSNSAALRGKVVMDLGCGTGVISLFCARLAQPAAVYAVEASSMAEHTEELVRQNGCEGVVSVFQDRAENITLPGKVDVLVSEWMGNCLLFEYMLESVLLARDRWLKEGGMMWPSSACLTVVPCQAFSDYRQKIEFWEKPYGLDFSYLQSLAQKEFLSKPKFSHHLLPEDCLSTPADVISLDMVTIQLSDLERLRGEFSFTVEKSGMFHGFTVWFRAHFQSLEEDRPSLELNTGPYSEITHWKQTLFMLDAPVTVEEGDIIVGSICLQRNPVWRRHLSITFSWNTNSTEVSRVQTKCFPMWR